MDVYTFAPQIFVNLIGPADLTSTSEYFDFPLDFDFLILRLNTLTSTGFLFFQPSNGAEVLALAIAAALGCAGYLRVALTLGLTHRESRQTMKAVGGAVKLTKCRPN